MCSLLDEMTLADSIISDLSQSLAPLEREAFRQEALVALASLEVLGPGVAWRVVAPLQRNYFTPPSDKRMAYDIASNQCRGNRLTNQAPIGRGYGPGRSLA
jgi:hypothetical protein